MSRDELGLRLRDGFEVALDVCSGFIAGKTLHITRSSVHWEIGQGV